LTSYTSQKTILNLDPPVLPKEWKLLQIEFTRGERMMYLEYDSLVLEWCRNILVNFYFLLQENSVKSSDFYVTLVRKILLHYIIEHHYFLGYQADLVENSYLEIQKEIKTKRPKKIFVGKLLQYDIDETIAERILKFGRDLVQSESSNTKNNSFDPGKLNRTRIRLVLRNVENTCQ
jgi:hypothetical protein